MGQSQGAGRFHLSRVRGQDAAADGFCNIGTGIDGKGDGRRQHAVGFSHDEGNDAEIGNEYLQEKGGATDAFDEAGRRDGQVFPGGNTSQCQKETEEEACCHGNEGELHRQKGAGDKEGRIFFQYGQFEINHFHHPCFKEASVFSSGFVWNHFS